MVPGGKKPASFAVTDLSARAEPPGFGMVLLACARPRYSQGRSPSHITRYMTRGWSPWS